MGRKTDVDEWDRRAELKKSLFTLESTAHNRLSNSCTLTKRRKEREGGGSTNRKVEVGEGGPYAVRVAQWQAKVQGNRKMQTPAPTQVNRIRMDGVEPLEFCLKFPRCAYGAARAKNLPRTTADSRRSHASGSHSPGRWRRGAHAQPRRSPPAIWAKGAGARYHWGRFPKHTPPDARPTSARAGRDDDIA